MINDMSFLERSLLFAKLSSIAYSSMTVAKNMAKDLGFNKVEFYEKDGAQAYRFMNKTDLVIACRGTQPTEFNDIKADLKAFPVMAETVSRVHRGFKDEVDELWPDICEDLIDKKQTVWFCGHSLGAAMATIMASRCMPYASIAGPQEIYTYGSPRVGWKKYCDNFGVIHHRWVNNNDAVTTVPFAIMGYKHHGIEHYMNSLGNISNAKGLQRVKDKFKGMWSGIKQGKIDNFADHSISLYIENLHKGQQGENICQEKNQKI
jgi:triacylglycerol lipase|tara:strand:+ start:428 stop:1213 length:786 start_codon:yes stop_codon:yes gene_type:complete